MVAAALEGYLVALQRQPLARRTRKTYAANVAIYADWLTQHGKEGEAALREPRARDFAARDFKRDLKRRGWKPTSINLALAAVDHFDRFIGLGPANVRREELPATAPRALSEEEQRSLLRAAESASARDRAIVVVLLNTGLRLGELAGLELADVRISARKGLIVVRSGKGDAYREVPLNRGAREAVERWLAERPAVAGEGTQALFVARSGEPLSGRAIDMAIRKVAARAGIKLSAHVLRHTCVTNLVRGGHDLVLVAELAGHRRLETTRRYSLPSAADRQAAMDSIELEDV